MGNCFCLYHLVILKSIVIIRMLLQGSHHIFCNQALNISAIYSETRSSHPEVFCKRVVLKKFTKFTGKHLCRSIFLIKLQAWRRPFLTEHLRWLFLPSYHIIWQFIPQSFLKPPCSTFQEKKICFVSFSGDYKVLYFFFMRKKGI